MCILWIEEVKDAQRDEKPKRRGRKGERNKFKRVEGPCSALWWAPYTLVKFIMRMQNQRFVNLKTTCQTHNGMFGWQNLGTRFWVIKIQISYLDSLKMIKGLDLTNTSKILTLKIRGINMGQRVMFVSCQSRLFN